MAIVFNRINASARKDLLENIVKQVTRKVGGVGHSSNSD